MNARQIYCNDYQANEFVSHADTEEEQNNPSKQLSITKRLKQDVSQTRDPYDYEIIKKPGQSPTTFVHNNATFGKEYNETVNQNKQLEFIYTYEESENEVGILFVGMLTLLFQHSISRFHVYLYFIS